MDLLACTTDDTRHLLDCFSFDMPSKLWQLRLLRADLARCIYMHFSELAFEGFNSLLPTVVKLFFFLFTSSFIHCVLLVLLLPLLVNKDIYNDFHSPAIRTVQRSFSASTCISRAPCPLSFALFRPIIFWGIMCRPNMGSLLEDCSLEL